jgi:hypothetical protein
MVEERASVRKPAVTERREQVAARSSPVATAHSVSAARTLQQRLGNRGTQAVAARIVARSSGPSAAPARATGIGALSISQPGDAHEREADSVADKVMRMAEPPSAPDASSGSTRAVVQRLCTECEEEGNGLKLQRKESSAAAAQITPSVSASINALKGGGQPLPASTRAFFEPRFGADFSYVRVHTDVHAARTADSINARAFTLGGDIAFAAGQFSPDAPEGQRLLAHELTHVVQQGAAGMAGPAPSPVQSSATTVSRKVAVQSTVNICHRVLTSRTFKVSEGGVRVVLALDPLDLEVPDCKDHAYWITLTRSRDWWPDDEIATCEGRTGGRASFSFGGLVSGAYYLTIHRVFDHPYCCIDGDILIFDEPIAADSSGCTRDEDITAMDIVHGALDLAGFIPVLGAIPDGINAAIYVAEGDWTSAGLSAVAMVPGWGDGVKFGVMAEKSAIKLTKKAAFELGEEGIAKGLKEVKAASKAEQAAAEAAAKAERESAQAAAKAEREAAERAEKEAAEKAEKEAAEKEKKKTNEKDTCLTKYPGELNCDVLSTYGYNYPSASAALALLKRLTGEKDLQLHNPAPTMTGPCPGRGMHYNVRSHGAKVGTIVCCPCCKDTPTGPKRRTLCRLL